MISTLLILTIGTFLSQAKGDPTKDLRWEPVCHLETPEYDPKDWDYFKKWMDILEKELDQNVRYIGCLHGRSCVPIKQFEELGALGKVFG